MTTPNQYLESHQISYYMEDCITQMLLYREDNPKVNARSFMAEYFKCLSSGNHVLLREFSFVTATPHNRLSFVRLIYRAYCNLNEVGNCLSLRELHSLLVLLCPDLPWPLVEKAGHTAHACGSSGGIAESPDVTRDARFLFSDFLAAFQIHFLYDEFLTKCGHLYDSMLSGGNRANIDVFLPTDQPQVGKEAADAGAATAGTPAGQQLQRVSSGAYIRLIEGVCQELQFHIPNMEIIRKSLGNNKTVTYREFVIGLVRNKELAAALGLISDGTPELYQLTDGPSLAPRPPTVNPVSHQFRSTNSSPATPASSQSQAAAASGTGPTIASSPGTSRPIGNQQQHHNVERLKTSSTPKSTAKQRQARLHHSSSSSSGSSGSGSSSASSDGRGGGVTDSDSDSV